MQTFDARIHNLLELPSIWDVADEITWIVDGLIAAGSLTLLSADSGTGKSWVSYAIAGAVANGGSFAGRDVSQRPVLYVDGENPPSVVKRNLRELAVKRTSDLHVWGRWVTQEPPGSPEHPLITTFAEERQGLIVFDSLIDFHEGDEQSASDTRQVMKKFRNLAARGATVLLLHHTGKSEKSQQYRGSSDFKAAVDAAFNLQQIRCTTGVLDELRLTQFKSRYGPPQHVNLKFLSGTGFHDIQTAVRSVATDRSNDPLAAIQQLLQGCESMMQKDILERLKSDFPRQTILDALNDTQRFVRRRGRGKAFVYSIAHRGEAA